jgi:GNAT superfamily N-acetyltransferase
MTMTTISASIDGEPVITRTAMKMEDSLQAFAVRAACFIGELDVPYTEEFDGHDFGATHIVAYLGEEPVGTVRMRWFQSFAMPERLCVIQRFRGHEVGRLLIERCRKLAESRGCNMLYVHVLPRDKAYWEKQGWRCLDPDAPPALNGTIALVRPVRDVEAVQAEQAPEVVTLRQDTATEYVRRA